MGQHHNKKFHNKNERKNPREFQQEQIELGEEDRWHPTPAQFDAYQARDFELAVVNVAEVFRSRRTPMTLKEVKDSTLHSPHTVERAVDSFLASDFIVEENGRFSLKAA
jgi:hypothetical protein